MAQEEGLGGRYQRYLLQWSLLGLDPRRRILTGLIVLAGAGVSFWGLFLPWRTLTVHGPVALRPASLPPGSTGGSTELGGYVGTVSLLLATEALVLLTGVVWPPNAKVALLFALLDCGMVIAATAASVIYSLVYPWPERFNWLNPDQVQVHVGLRPGFLVSVLGATIAAIPIVTALIRRPPSPQGEMTDWFG
jgi:hypothetical protein